MNPCIRKQTMPSRPVSGVKRSLETEEEVSSSTKILKSILESETKIESQNSNLSNDAYINLIDDLNLSDNESIPQKANPGINEDIIILDDETETDKRENTEENKIQTSMKTTQNSKLKTVQKKHFKSVEFVDSDSSLSDQDSPPKPKEAIQIDALPSKKQMIRCSFILVKGSRKGEQCSHWSRTSLCTTHKKEKKDTLSKNELIKLLEETKKENQIIHQEVLALKKHNSKLDTFEKNKEEKEKTHALLRRNVIWCKKNLVEMLNLKSTKTGIKSKRSKLIQRRKLSQLNRGKIYRLIKYSSVPRFEAKEGIFQLDDNMLKVVLPKKMDRKDESEDWVLQYSLDTNRFEWNKV